MSAVIEAYNCVISFQAPTITGVRVYTHELESNEVILDFNIMWAMASNFILTPDYLVNPYMTAIMHGFAALSSWNILRLSFPFISCSYDADVDIDADVKPAIKVGVKGLQVSEAIIELNDNRWNFIQLKFKSCLICQARSHFWFTLPFKSLGSTKSILKTYAHYGFIYSICSNIE